MLNRKFIRLIGIVVLLNGIQAGFNKPLLPNRAGSSSTSFFRGLHGMLNENSALETEAKKERGGQIWKRPDEIAKYPHTWHRFVRESSTGEKVKFVIKDIPEIKYDEIVNFIAINALNSTPICKALDIFSDAEAVNGFKLEWKLILKQKMSVACFRDDGSDTIVGINLMSVPRQDDLIKTLIPITWNNKLHKIYDINEMIEFNMYERYAIEEYLCSSYLGVDPNYESFEINEELFRIAEKICWTFSIELSIFYLSSPELDQIAEKERLKLERGLSYTDLREEIPNLKNFVGYGFSVRSMYFKRQGYEPPK